MENVPVSRVHFRFASSWYNCMVLQQDKKVQHIHKAMQFNFNICMYRYIMFIDCVCVGCWRCIAIFTLRGFTSQILSAVSFSSCTSLIWPCAPFLLRFDFNGFFLRGILINITNITTECKLLNQLCSYGVCILRYLVHVTWEVHPKILRIRKIVNL